MKVLLDESCSGPLADNPKRVYRYCKAENCEAITLYPDGFCDRCHPENLKPENQEPLGQLVLITAEADKAQGDKEKG